MVVNPSFYGYNMAQYKENILKLKNPKK